MSCALRPDPWGVLAEHTPARIALGACGSSLPTAEVLKLGVAHAQARDAVHQPMALASMQQSLQALGAAVVCVRSMASDRQTYLRRPDWGRVLSADSVQALSGHDAAPCDVVCVVADGLSSTAVQRYAAALLAVLLPALRQRGLRTGPVVLAEQARVALGDPVAQALGAQLVLVLIGERPGLSASDSMGAYLTWNPQPGMADAGRNCVSNIRDAGLPVERAAAKLLWLIAQAWERQLTGIDLKDDSDGQPALPVSGSASDAALLDA